MIPKNQYAGKIFKIPFPFTNLEQNKFRPALAISEPDSYGDIEFLFITTKHKRIIDQTIEIPANLLPYKSILHIDKKVTLNKRIIVKEFCKVPNNFFEKVLRETVLNNSRSYYNHIHKPKNEAEFLPGKTKLNYGGRYFGEKELQNAVEASLDFWLTTGRYAKEFETNLAEFLGTHKAYLVNSGSSANLLAFMALTSPLLGERKISLGDEVITVAAGFPTTVSPIIQYGAVPVFIDITLDTYNIDCTQLEKAISSKTKAVMLAHTLGNPFDIKRVKEFCDINKLWLIEDNCDALGSRYRSLDRLESLESLDGLNRLTGLAKPSQLPSSLNSSTSPSTPNFQYTGTFGDLSTCSFYPPHHMTMGEGGAVIVNNNELDKIVLSMRDWGRDCICQSGQDNLCNNRFNGQYGELPEGYDHKYVYSHFGYNLKRKLPSENP